jgi:hypothetical protein
LNLVTREFREFREFLADQRLPFVQVDLGVQHRLKVLLGQ